MDKYIIVNEAYNSILCKDKYGSRRYRQDRNNIDKHCIVLKTTRGRAEQERDYLNKNYNEGWKIQKVEPIVFVDNEIDREKYLSEYETLREEEVKEIERQTAEDFAKLIKSKLFDLGNIVNERDIDDILKEFLEEVKND